MRVVLTFTTGREIEITNFALFWKDQFGTRQYAATEEYSEWADSVADRDNREEDAP